MFVRQRELLKSMYKPLSCFFTSSELILLVGNCTLHKYPSNSSLPITSVRLFWWSQSYKVPDSKFEPKLMQDAIDKHVNHNSANNDGDDDKWICPHRDADFSESFASANNAIIEKLNKSTKYRESSIGF